MSIANITTALPVTAGTGIDTTNRSATAAPGSVDVRQAVADVQRKTAEVAEAKPDVEEIRAATEKLSEYIDVVSRSLNIKVDRDLQEPIVTVLDATTDQIIRQIPSEEVVAIAKFLRSQEALQSSASEALAGVLFREQT